MRKKESVTQALARRWTKLTDEYLRGNICKPSTRNEFQNKRRGLIGLLEQLFAVVIKWIATQDK